MRNLVRGLAVASALALAACGGEGGGKAELNVYNWSDYIDPELLEEFTTESGFKVVYDTFDSDDVLETKVLTGGTGYDVVTPSNSKVARFIAAGALQPLDKARLSNLGNLDPTVMAFMEPFDPGQQYTVPYMWGTVGVGFNEAAVTQRLPGVDLDSWALVFDPANLAKLADCGVYFLDSAEDMFPAALKYLGKDPNSATEADYVAAADLLLAVKPHVRKFHSSEYIDALANGDICLAVGYSGDIFQAADRAEEAEKDFSIGYVIPSEGSQVWFDVFAIPADARDLDAAYAFLDFMLRPEVIARASNYLSYANANGPGRALVDEEIRENAAIYPTPEVMARLWVARTKEQELLRQVNRQWTRVLTGQ